MDQVVRSGLSWDVMGGVGRRGWARNPNAIETVQAWNEKHGSEGHITVPTPVDDAMLDALLEQSPGQ